MNTPQWSLAVWIVLAVCLLGFATHAAADAGTLYIRRAVVIDNGEGSNGGSKWRPRNWGQHGPVGNLHVLVYESNMYTQLRQAPGRTSYPRPLHHFVLRGPTRHEWDDGDVRDYADHASLGVALFRWRFAQDAITVFVYESDPDRALTRREHDPIFLGLITREETARGRIYASMFPAHRDAVARAEQRRGPALRQLLEGTHAWYGPLRLGMPRMFLYVQTFPMNDQPIIRAQPAGRRAVGVQ